MNKTIEQSNLLKKLLKEELNQLFDSEEVIFTRIELLGEKTGINPNEMSKTYMTGEHTLNLNLVYERIKK